jgi:hypothetical protein
LINTGPLIYRLWSNYLVDNSNTLCYGSQKNIKKMIDQYEPMLDTKPRKYIIPIEKIYCPAIDCSDDLDDAGKKIYQMMNCSLQLAITLGRFDILTATMTLSRFRTSTR